MLLSAILAASLGAAGARAEGAPRIEFDRTVYDFGATSRVESVAGAFIVQNTGDAALRVTGLRASCACIRARIEPATVPPGETGRLDFFMTLGPAVGDLVEQIYVATNDPLNTNVVLTLKLRIAPVYEITPAQVLLGDVPTGSTTNIAVLVHRADGNKLRITKVQIDDVLVAARVVPVKQSKGESARILLTIRIPATPGPLHQTVYVHTGEEFAEGIPRPSFEFDVTGRAVESSR
jgi:hypothetical protein